MAQEEMIVFTTNYHISVNPTLIQDLNAVGLRVVMPSPEFSKGRIAFYAPNDEHTKIAHIIDYKHFMAIEEPIIILIPCIQLIDDFMKLYKARGERDVIMYLTANSDSANHFPLDGSDYILTHDMDYHRLTKAKYKVMYFNQPRVTGEKKDEKQLVKTFNEKKLKLYINNFDKAGFEPEYACALQLRKEYKKATGWRIPFYGYGMPDGWLKPEEAHEHMVDSMFSVVFKRRETWGQMVNESMQLGTPSVFMPRFIYSTFKDYLITPDTAIISNSVDEIVKQITSLRFEDYETIVNEAYHQSLMFCNDQNRQSKVSWLFDKVAKDPKMKV